MTDKRDSIAAKNDQGLVLFIKAKPGVRQARAARIVDLGEGKSAIEISVSEIAEDGKANAAIIAQLAKVLKVKKAAIEIRSGPSGRLKLISVFGEPDDLAARLKKWIGA